MVGDRPGGFPPPDRLVLRGQLSAAGDVRIVEVALQLPVPGDPSSMSGTERRRRAERALTTVVATCYLRGLQAADGEACRAPGITRLSKSQVSEMAKDLDVQVADFRHRPLDAGPYTFVVAADALVLEAREGGCAVNVHALVATGVNGDGHREILGLQVTSAEDGAGWLSFFRDLTARGLTGVQLVTPDAHAGLVTAIRATLHGASWQRCRTHYTANLMAVCPKNHLAVGAGAAATHTAHTEEATTQPAIPALSA